MGYEHQLVYQICGKCLLIQVNFLMARESYECRLWVSENSVQRGIFWPKREEITGAWR